MNNKKSILNENIAQQTVGKKPMNTFYQKKIIAGILEKKNINFQKTFFFQKK